MTQTSFSVNIPSNLINLGIDQDEIQRRISEWLVFSLFSEGKISSGKAGKLLGISRLEFIKLLKTRGISFVNYTEDEIKEELEAVKILETKKKSLHKHPAFGSWDKQNKDGLNYQSKMRSEWDK